MEFVRGFRLLLSYNNANKRLLEIVYILIVAIMAIGTIVGKYTSLDYVSDNIFGSLVVLFIMGNRNCCRNHLFY